MTLNEYALFILRDSGCNYDSYASAQPYYKTGEKAAEQARADLMESDYDCPAAGFSYEDVAAEIVRIGDANYKKSEKAKYQMIYDGDHFIDGVDFNDLEAAKQDAFSTLSMWLEDAMATWSRDRDGMPCPTPEQIEDHDYMICNFRVYVRELVDPDAEDEDDMYEEIWSPSYEDENRIGWLEWSEARPWYEKQIAAAKAVGREE